MRRSYTYSLELPLRGFLRDAESPSDFTRAHSVARKLLDRGALRVRRRPLDQPRRHPDRPHSPRDRDHTEVELGPHRRIEFARLVIDEHRSHEPVLQRIGEREPVELSPQRPVRPMAVVGASEPFPAVTLALVGYHSRRRRLARQLGGVGKRQTDVGVPCGLAARAALLAAPVADEAQHPSPGYTALSTSATGVAGHVPARSRTGVRFERAARRRIGIVERFEQEANVSYTFGEVGHYHFPAHRASADRARVPQRADILGPEPLRTYVKARRLAMPQRSPETTPAAPAPRQGSCRQAALRAGKWPVARAPQPERPPADPAERVGVALPQEQGTPRATSPPTQSRRSAACKVTRGGKTRSLRVTSCRIVRVSPNSG